LDNSTPTQLTADGSKFVFNEQGEGGGPDSRRIIFSAMKTGEVPQLFAQEPDGGGPSKAFGQNVAMSVFDRASISSDGRFMARDAGGRPLLQS
jgi:hypothetical protein